MATVLVALTEEELRDRNQTLAGKIHSLTILEADKKEQVGEYNSQIKALKKEIYDLATAVRSGQEERDEEAELPGIRKLRDVS